MGTNEISADELVARLTKIYGAAFDAVARDYTLDSPRKAGIVAVLEFLTATSRLVSADDIRLTTVRRADVITVANAALQYGDSTLGEAAHRILSQFPITGTVNPTTEPDDTDTEQRTESESFSFLNELAGAFRHGEANPRPSHFPVLEGIRAVLAHLHSAGRLLSADEQRPTAEQVENVRTARKTLRGYRNYERHHVNQLIAAVDALFPATEPAEAKGGTIISGLIDCHASYTLTAEEYADFLNVIWEGRGDYSSRDRLREKFPTSEHDEARLQRKSALASSDGDCFDVCEGHPAGMTMAHIHHHEAEPPAPAEPAEEETKAERWTVSTTYRAAGPSETSDDKARIERFADAWRASGYEVTVTPVAEGEERTCTQCPDYAHGGDGCDLDPSPVVPAPTETSAIGQAATALRAALDVVDPLEDGDWEHAWRTVEDLEDCAKRAEAIAPNETGPWQTWQEVPDDVWFTSASAVGFLPAHRKRGSLVDWQFRDGSVGVYDVSRIGNGKLMARAPFVAAEETK